MNQKIKPKDIETLEVIKAYIEENKIPPSLEELMQLLNLSTKTSVRARLKRLSMCGEIEYEGRTARSIKLAKYDYVLVPKKTEQENSACP